MRLMMSHWHVTAAQRRLLVAVLLALVLAFVFPGISQAHAILLRSDPAKDAVLSVPPDQVRMWFSEDLNPALSTAVVVNGINQRVDQRDATISPNDPREMDVTLPTLSGGTIPGQNALGGSNLTGLYTGQLDGPTLFNLIMITLFELGAVFWVGASLWQIFVLQPAAEDHPELSTTNQQAKQRFERRFALPTLLVLLVANIGVLLGQAVIVTGGNFAAALAPTLLASLVTGGRFGTYWLVRVVVIVLALRLSLYLVQLHRLQFKPRTRLVNDILPWTNLLLGLVLFIAIAMSSHASAVSQNIMVYAVVLDWLHLVAAALWVGGMLYIATSYLPVLRQVSIAERARSLVTVLPYYTPWAIAGVVIMAVTGPFSATVHLTSWEQLLSTAYGRALVVKILLVGGLLLTSAIHVGLLRPRLKKELQKYAYVVGRLKSVQAQKETRGEGKVEQKK